MDERRKPTPETANVEVAVTRTGGFAGLQRRWHAAPTGTDASEWVALIRSCPWHESATQQTQQTNQTQGAPAPAGADRFVWLISARYGDELDKQAELADDQVTGAWLVLIDAVREWSDAVQK